MAKEFVSGLVVWANRLEWASFQPARGGYEKVEGGAADLTVPEDAPAELEVPSEDIAAEIKAACSSLKGQVAVGLPSEPLIMRVLQLPVVTDDELKGMVELQVDKFSPFPVENMVVSHEILSREENALLVLAAAAKRDSVRMLGLTLGAAGILPYRLDAAVLGWLRLLREKDEIKPEGREVVLLLNGLHADMVVFQEGVPILFRAITGRNSLPGEEFAAGTAEEIRYTLMSLDLERGPSPQTRTTLWSRDSEEALARSIREECSCAVEVKDLGSLGSVAEGIALRGLAHQDALDLTPAEWRELTGKARFRKRMITAAVTVAAVWALSVGIVFGGLAYQRKRLDFLKAELERWRAPALEVREMRRRVYVVQSYADRSHSALECLREVSNLLPSGVELGSFSYRKGESVSVSGEADTSRQVLEFNTRLNDSQLFPKVDSGGQSVTREGKHRFQFELLLPEEQ